MRAPRTRLADTGALDESWNGRAGKLPMVARYELVRCLNIQENRLSNIVRVDG